MREKIIKIIDNGISEWMGIIDDGEYQKKIVLGESGKNKVATEIISTLIESLPEEYAKNRITSEYVDGIEMGYNKYRSEVINLLRGN
jgi:hypothetical protein